MAACEVLAIGDELTSGQRVDTNSAWISRQLNDVGLAVRFHTTVADDLQALRDAIGNAAERAELVFCTGGLGPTADDLTRQALASAAAVSLELDETSLAHIQHLFDRRGREMPPQNRVQAMFPVGSQIIPNPQGTAPGIDFTWRTVSGRTCRVLALPGVPAEMREMWYQTVLPTLRRAGHGQQVIQHYRLKCFGVGESALESMLPDLIHRGRSPSVGITVHRATITLRVSSRGTDAQTCRQEMQSTIATIHECLGDLVFGEEDDELQDAVTRLLSQRQQRVATVDLATGGLVAHWLDSSDSHGQAHAGSLVARRANDVLSLWDLPAMPSQRESDNLEFCRTIADCCRQRFHCDYALALGPRFMAREEGPPSDPEAEGKSGTSSERERVHICLAHAKGQLSSHQRLVGHDEVRVQRTAKVALNMLRRYLIGHSA